MRSLLVLLPFVAQGAAFAAAPPPPAPEPFKAVVKDGAIVTCYRPHKRPWDYGAYLTSGPISSNSPRRSVYCMGTSPGMPIRWHVKSKGFWVASSIVGGIGILSDRPKSNGAQILQRYDLGGLLGGNRLPTDRAAEPDDPMAWKPSAGGDTPAELAHSRGSDFSFDFAVYCDYQPLDDFRVRQFLLTDVLKYDRDKRELTEKEKATPAWSFDVFRYRAVFDEKQEWVQGKWKFEASLPVAFREPFFALGRGEDWYFLTESGRLFLSPDPGKGKERTVVPVWKDRARPVLGQIQDATTGKTFLFLPPARRGGKPAFFELSDKPKPVEYDPQLVPMPPLALAEPHRTILHAARVLVALKKIKGK